MNIIGKLVAHLGLNDSEFSQKIKKNTEQNKKFKKTVDANNRSLKKQSSALSGAAKSAALIDGPLGGVASRLSVANGMLASNSSKWLAAGAAISATTYLIKKSIDAQAQLERGLFKTEALIKATGGAAGFTTKEFDKFARQLARDTLANPAGIRSAINVMQTFKTVSGPIFKRSIRLSQDLAAVMGTDAKTAALQLGKALEDPATGMTALKRSGVSFTEAEKDVIKQLQKTNRLAEAQAMILDKLHGQLGGAGKAEAQGISGAADSAAQSWEEFLEALADKTGSGEKAKSFLNSLSSILDDISVRLNPKDEAGLNYYNQTINKLQKQLDLQLELDNNRLKGVSQPPSIIYLQQEIDGLKKKRQIIIDQLNIDKQQQDIAEEKGKKVQENLAKERELDQLKKSQNKGLQELEKLERLFRDKEEKARFSHKQRLRDINNFNLSKEEIEKRDFDNILALRSHLAEKSKTLLDNELAQFKLSSEQKNKAEQERANAKIERDKQEKQRVLDKTTSLFNSVHQKALEAENNKIQLENERHDRLMNQLTAEVELLREKYNNELLLDSEFKLAKEEAETLHQENIKQINEDSAMEQGKTWGNFNDFMKRAAGDAATDMLMDHKNAGDRGKQLLKSLGRTALSTMVQIGVEKIKQFAISKSIMSAETAANVVSAKTIAVANAPAAAAVSLASYGSNSAPAQVGMASTFALSNALALTGMAHDGIASVPQDGTWLLQKGERVIPRDDNKELMQAVGNDRKLNISLIINNNGEPINANATAQQNGDNLEIMVDLIRQTVSSDIRDGSNEIADSYEQIYQVNRAGGL